LITRWSNGPSDLGDDGFEVGEVDDHADLVELARGDVDPHPVVVAVQVRHSPRCAADGVRGGEL
jgi:hypothetical protein